MATQPREIYPNATHDGKAIPLEVIKPISIVRLTVDSISVESVTFSDDDLQAVFYSDVDSFVFFNRSTSPLPLVDGTEYENTVFVPANTLVTVSPISGPARVCSSTGEGYFYIQRIDRWAALDRNLNAIRR